MKMNVLLLTLVIASSAPLVAWSADLGQPLTWQSSQAAKLNQTPDLARVAERLIVQYDLDGDTVQPIVGEAKFIDLDGDGTLELVALVDYSGRLFFNNIAIITARTDSPVVTIYRSNGTNMHDLDQRIISKPGSPKKLLVVDRFIDRYEGSLPSPKEQRLLELNSSGLQDVSKQHRDYYLKRLEVLEKQAGMFAGASAKSASIASSTSPTERDENFVLKQELERTRMQTLGE
ncbi:MULTISPECIES: hypothetical protein [Xanthomonas]|uniref:EF-hand domain-containing protein n=1 Tax=Xanthomonas phaseoli pv. dieffenbachiae TaxID=92828 RepID=A0A1V9HH99_9XANT|nr:hypothetical protein [Xanthomonas phaseoli]MBO9769978.1 hypothetical protein [Xanthomonas phaseoli pv. dieffenbachiae]MBO9778066.1 hypothetical protein [Xanthomonas phaseoli pv. dieffenbachiae]MBO9782164.1 hypothetical protein [Xanthomonas phaseoli pv. dieffenbachiae]MBO9789378.1 hypothetical protein [Xanthomonas phaseoli pv. dieffenbachiae]MBO9797988.1 hypothetical protein [Xanthomonas phaseoli pv. dieffenbachiae]